MNCLVIFIVLLGLTSCGMQKQVVSQDTQAERTAAQTDSLRLRLDIDKIVRESINELMSMEFQQNIEIERTMWSPPDSTGAQHVVQEEKVKSVTVAKETKKSEAETLVETAEKIDSVSVSAGMEELVVETVTDIEEKDGLPWWQQTLMYIGAAVLIIIAIKIALKFI